MAEATLHIQVRPVVRYVHICCPACECVQGAAVQYLAACLPVYVHRCIYCDYEITESEWDEVDDDELE